MTYMPLSRKTWLIFLVVILFLAFAVRVYRLNLQGLWYDESDRLLIAAMPWNRIFPTMVESELNTLPFYYLVLKPFAQPFNEVFARFPPLFFGVLGVAVIATLGRRLLGPLGGLMAAMLLAFNTFHVWYSRDATFYTLMVLSSAGALYFFLRLLRDQRFGLWAGLTLFTGLGLWTHYHSFIMPVTEMIFIILTFRSNYRILRPWFLSQVIAFVPLVPWYIWLILRGQYYIGLLVHTRPIPIEVFYTFWNFSLGYTGQYSPAIVLSLIAFGLALAWGLGVLLKRRTEWAGVLVLWLALPIVVTYLLSFRLPMYVDRYLIPALPAFILIIVGGLMTLGRCRRAAGLTILMVASVIATVRIFYDPIYNKEDWRGVARYIEENEKIGDVGMPLFYQSLEPLYGHYYHGQVKLEPIQVGLKVRDPAEIVQGYRRAWLILPNPHPSQHLLAQCLPFDVFNVSTYGSPPPREYERWLEANRSRVVEVKPFTCIQVLLFDLSSPDAP
jgi:4-amino-4-deoxy-L-arabinose transferase-like glycosyltransferase